MRHILPRTYLLAIVCLITNNFLSAQFSQADYFLREAKNYEQENLLEEALDYYNLALNENPSHLEALYSRSSLKYKLGYLPTALYDLDNIFLINPYDARALELRGFIHFDLGNYDKALSDFQNSLNNHKTAQGYLNIGLTLNSMKNHELALEHFSKALDLKREMFEAHCAKGDTYVAMGEPHFEKALESYAASLNINEKDALTLKNRGVLYLMMGHYENAVDDFEKAIDVQADFELYLYLAQCRLEQGQEKEAYAILLNHALPLDEEYPEFYFTLGLVEKALGKPQEALESFLVAADYDRYNSNYFLEIGDMEQQLGNHFRAVTAYYAYLDLVEGDFEVNKKIEICFGLIEEDNVSAVANNYSYVEETTTIEFQSREIPATYSAQAPVEREDFSNDIFEE